MTITCLGPAPFRGVANRSTHLFQRVSRFSTDIKHIHELSVGYHQHVTGGWLYSLNSQFWVLSQNETTRNYARTCLSFTKPMKTFCVFFFVFQLLLWSYSLYSREYITALPSINLFIWDIPLNHLPRLCSYFNINICPTYLRVRHKKQSRELMQTMNCN